MRAYALHAAAAGEETSACALYCLTGKRIYEDAQSAAPVWLSDLVSVQSVGLQAG